MEFDRDESLETSVIGARQCEQGWISIRLDVKQNSGSAVGMTLSPIGSTESDPSIAKWSLQQWSDIASKTFPNLINPLIKRVKSGMKTLVVKAEYMANYDNPEKPMVMIEVLNSLLCRISDDVDEA
jgi:hypothetical protein